MDTFRHSYVDEYEQLNLARVDATDPLIVRNTFTLAKHELREVVETALKLKDPFFRELAKNYLISENLVRESHS